MEGDDGEKLANQHRHSILLGVLLALSTLAAVFVLDKDVRPSSSTSTIATLSVEEPRSGKAAQVGGVAWTISSCT